MAFVASNEMFDSIFGEEEQVSLARDFLNQLSDYLHRQQGVPSAIKMAEWIDQGKALAAFRCREDVLRPMAEDMLKQEIPFVATITPSGRTGFLTRGTDQNAVLDIKTEILKQKSRVCRVVSGKDMQELAAASKRPDKTLLVVPDLTEAQVALLKRQLLKHVEDPIIGVDIKTATSARRNTTYRPPNKGGYVVYIPAAENIKMNYKEGTDICKMFLDVIIKSEGINSVANTAPAMLDEQMAKMMANGFREPGVNRNKTPLYIAGAGRQFLKITAGGFEYGRAQRENGITKLQVEYQASDMQPDYKKLLVSFYERIPDKMFSTDLTALMTHMDPQLNALEAGDVDIFSRANSDAERVVNLAETELADVLDVIVKRKIQGEPTITQGGHWGEKFNRYAQEAGAVLVALAEGRSPKGYEFEDVAALRKIFDTYSIDPAHYETVSHRLMETETIGMEKTIERIVDISEAINEQKLELIEAQERAKEEEHSRRGGRGYERDE